MREDQQERLEKLEKVKGANSLCHDLCKYFEENKIPKDVAIAGMMNVLLLLVEINALHKNTMKTIFQGGIDYLKEIK